jgi:NTE family protein
MIYSKSYAMNNETKNIALVLSGGGARGMAHIGVIEALIEEGYTITSLAGSSIGSLIGGIYLSGKLPEFEEWVMGISKFDMIRLMDFVLSKNGFIKGEKIFKELKRFIGDRNIEDLGRPYAAIAVDLKNHREIIFTTGKLVKAIRASVSIPTLLRPARYQDLYLVDGGLLNPLPLDSVHRSGSDLLVGVDLNADIPYDFQLDKSSKVNSDEQSNYEKGTAFINKKWSKYFHKKNKNTIGYFDLITHSIYTMQMRLTQLAIEKYKPDLVIGISKKSCEIFEFHRVTELRAYGKEQTHKAIDHFKKGVSLVH